jgi:hypothetical protein
MKIYCSRLKGIPLYKGVRNSGLVQCLMEDGDDVVIMVLMRFVVIAIIVPFTTMLMCAHRKVISCKYQQYLFRLVSPSLPSKTRDGYTPQAPHTPSFPSQRNTQARK